MKFFNKFILIGAICQFKVLAYQGFNNNLVFYNRYQENIENYWNNIDKIRGSPNTKIYLSNNEHNENSNDESQANSLVLFLPGKRNLFFSNINFNITNDERTIDLTNFRIIKSEIKLVAPTAEELISKGYTCENIGLSCTDLNDYNFNNNTKEWLSKVDLRFFLESDGNYLNHYEIMGNPKPSNVWSEFIGRINKSTLPNKKLIYTDLAFRNYGLMPIYVYIGDTVFLKDNDINMLRESTEVFKREEKNFKQKKDQKKITNSRSNVSISCNDVYNENIYYRECNVNDLGQVENLIIDQCLTTEKFQYIFEIGSLKTLELLFYYCINKIPSEIGNLTNLEKLIINNNNINTIPSAIGKLSKLQELDLRNNRIKYIPYEIENLSNLKKLDLSNNEINEIPPEIGSLSQLSELWLDGNPITEISSEIKKLSHLEKLYFRNFDQETFPTEILNIKNLETLVINFNQVTEVPSEIEKLSKLKILELSGRKIKKIPSEIGKLINLEELNIHNTRITEIPSEIGKLSKLKKLWLNNNRITEISSSISDLQMLEYLSLSGNAIKEIPSLIGNFINLNELEISNNCIKCDENPELNIENYYCSWDARNEEKCIGKISEISITCDDLSKNNITFSSCDTNYFEQVSNLSIYRKSLTNEQLQYIFGIETLKSLGLYGSQIKEIPKEIGNLSNLEELQISNSEITKLPSEIGKLSKLRYAYIYSNKITELPSAIGNLTNLNYLDLTYNRISKLPSEIGNLSELNELNLCNNEITKIPSEIGNLSNLYRLDLSNNQITGIPSGIGNFTNLNELLLNNNQITEIPSAVGNFTNLQYLYLNNNQIEKISTEIGNLKNLRYLDLNYNRITGLPSGIGNITNLEYLYLNNNQIKKIPSEIGNLTNLRYLNLFTNNITEIPPEIGNLTRIYTLNMSNNQIKVISTEVLSFPNLRNNLNLNLENNQITEFPSNNTTLLNSSRFIDLNLKNNQITKLLSQIGNLTNINRLDISNNKITELPLEIGNLTNINSLDISNNKIAELPSEIGNLTNINSLDISNNKITELPSEIGNLSNLNNLYLSGNEIKKIPLEIKNMGVLRYLNLNNNNLKTIPSEIFNITSLNRLYLSSNQIKSVPPEIENLSYLSELYLNNNNITEIPSEILNNQYLENLDLSNNQISDLPSEIGNLSYLRYLYLNNNQLKKIPQEIENLSELYRLYLNNNELKEIPSEIFKLQNLRELNLSGNQIKEIFLDYDELSYFWYINLSDNLLKEIPYEIGNLPYLDDLNISDNCIKCSEKPEFNNLYNYECTRDNTEKDKCKWKTCENESGAGYYFENNNLKYYNGTNSYTYENPKPGYYMNKCKEKRYIKCSSKGCKSRKLPTENEECNALTDGKLIKMADGLVVCTKINELNSTISEVNTSKYIGISLSSVNENDRYLVHHAGDVFNFERMTSNNYYVVSKNTTFVVFDPMYKDVKDHCASISGLMMNRTSDFCSSDSSGMYYTCTTGKCTSEFQVDKDHFENNGESECNCYRGRASETCSRNDIGYYYEAGTQYFYDGNFCKKIKITSEPTIGFYWNNYQYNKISNFDGEKFSAVVPTIVTSNNCGKKKNELVDTGFNLVFCNGNSRFIPILSTTKTIFTKGINNTLFNDNNKYYALKKNENNLVINYSINGSVTTDGIELDCNRGECTVISRVCHPESSNSNDYSGCDDGYYLISNYLYYCDNSICERKDMVGYFDNVASNNYIKCISNGTKITCNELNAPTESNNTCLHAGDLLYVNGRDVKLCLDTNTKNAIEIFKEDTANYFMQGNILNSSLSNNKYNIIGVSENSVIILNVNQEQRHYLYTFKNYKIIQFKNQCSTVKGETVQDLVEYEKDDTSNTYILLG